MMVLIYLWIIPSIPSIGTDPSVLQVTRYPAEAGQLERNMRVHRSTIGELLDER